MHSTISKLYKTSLYSAALFLILATPTLALERLTIEVDIEDYTAEVDVSYRKDGKNVREEFTYNNIDTREILFKKIASDLNINESEVEDVAEIDSDDSFERGEAAEYRTDALAHTDALDALQDATSEDQYLSKTDITKITEAVTETRKLKRLIEKGFSAEDYDDIKDQAEDIIDIVTDVFDDLDVDIDTYLDKTVSERLTAITNALTEADETYTETVSLRNRANRNKTDIGEAEVFLKEADELLDRARDAFGEKWYVSALRLAQDSETESEKAAEEISEIVVAEKIDKIELISVNGVARGDKIAAEYAIEKSDFYSNAASAAINAFGENERTKSDRQDAVSEYETARDNLSRAKTLFEDGKYDDSLEQTKRADARLELVFKILKATKPTYTQKNTTTVAPSNLSTFGNTTDKAELQKQIDVLLALIIDLLNKQLSR